MLALALAAASAQAQQGQAAGGPSASGEVKPAAERANDFPTLARVEYVFECLGDNPGPRHEMLYKCVCAVDRVAEKIPYDRWVDLSTFFKAQPMAGERGAYVRERSDIQSHLKSYRELQAGAKKACFISSGK
jgi:RecA-family ATPase